MNIVNIKKNRSQKKLNTANLGFEIEDLEALSDDNYEQEEVIEESEEGRIQFLTRLELPEELWREILNEKLVQRRRKLNRQNPEEDESLNPLQKFQLAEALQQNKGKISNEEDNMTEEEIIHALQKINIVDILNKQKDVNLPQFIKDMIDEDPQLMQKLKEIHQNKSQIRLNRKSQKQKEQDQTEQQQIQKLNSYQLPEGVFKKQSQNGFMQPENEFQPVNQLNPYSMPENNRKKFQNLTKTPEPSEPEVYNKLNQFQMKQGEKQQKMENRNNQEEEVYEKTKLNQFTLDQGTKKKKEQSSNPEVVESAQITNLKGFNVPDGQQVKKDGKSQDIEEAQSAPVTNLQGFNVPDAQKGKKDGQTQVEEEVQSAPITNLQGFNVPDAQKAKQDGKIQDDEESQQAPVTNLKGFNVPDAQKLKQDGQSQNDEEVQQGPVTNLKGFNVPDAQQKQKEGGFIDDDEIDNNPVERLNGYNIPDANKAKKGKQADSEEIEQSNVEKLNAFKLSEGTNPKQDKKTKEEIIENQRVEQLSGLNIADAVKAKQKKGNDIQEAENEPVERLTGLKFDDVKKQKKNAHKDQSDSDQEQEQKLAQFQEGQRVKQNKFSDNMIPISQSDEDVNNLKKFNLVDGKKAQKGGNDSQQDEMDDILNPLNRMVDNNERNKLKKQTDYWKNDQGDENGPEKLKSFDPNGGEKRKKKTTIEDQNDDEIFDRNQLKPFEIGQGQQQKSQKANENDQDDIEQFNRNLKILQIDDQGKQKQNKNDGSDNEQQGNGDKLNRFQFTDDGKKKQKKQNNKDSDDQDGGKKLQTMDFNDQKALKKKNKQNEDSSDEEQRNKLQTFDVWGNPVNPKQKVLGNDGEDSENSNPLKKFDFQEKSKINKSKNDLNDGGDDQSNPLRKINGDGSNKDNIIDLDDEDPEDDPFSNFIELTPQDQLNRSNIKNNPFDHDNFESKSQLKPLEPSPLIIVKQDNPQDDGKQNKDDLNPLKQNILDNGKLKKGDAGKDLDSDDPQNKLNTLQLQDGDQNQKFGEDQDDLDPNDPRNQLNSLQMKDKGKQLPQDGQDDQEDDPSNPGLQRINLSDQKQNNQQNGDEQEDDPSNPGLQRINIGDKQQNNKQNGDEQEDDPSNPGLQRINLSDQQQNNQQNGDEQDDDPSNPGLQRINLNDQKQNNQQNGDEQEDDDENKKNLLNLYPDKIHIKNYLDPNDNKSKTKLEPLNPAKDNSKKQNKFNQSEPGEDSDNSLLISPNGYDQKGQQQGDVSLIQNDSNINLIDPYLNNPQKHRIKGRLDSNTSDPDLSINGMQRINLKDAPGKKNGDSDNQDEENKRNKLGFDNNQLIMISGDDLDNDDDDDNNNDPNQKKQNDNKSKSDQSREIDIDEMNNSQNSQFIPNFDSKENDDAGSKKKNNDPNSSINSKNRVLKTQKVVIRDKDLQSDGQGGCCSFFRKCLRREADQLVQSNIKSPRNEDNDLEGNQIRVQLDPNHVPKDFFDPTINQADYDNIYNPQVQIILPNQPKHQVHPSSENEIPEDLISVDQPSQNSSQNLNLRKNNKKSKFMDTKFQWWIILGLFFVALIIFTIALVSFYKHKESILSRTVVIDEDPSLRQRIQLNQETNLFLRNITPGLVFEYNYTQIIEQVNVGPKGTNTSEKVTSSHMEHALSFICSQVHPNHYQMFMFVQNTHIKREQMNDQVFVGYPDILTVSEEQDSQRVLEDPNLEDDTDTIFATYQDSAHVSNNGARRNLAPIDIFSILNNSQSGISSHDVNLRQESKIEGTGLTMESYKISSMPIVKFFADKNGTVLNVTVPVNMNGAIWVGLPTLLSQFFPIINKEDFTKVAKFSVDGVYEEQKYQINQDTIRIKTDRIEYIDPQSQIRQTYTSQEIVTFSNKTSILQSGETHSYLNLGDRGDSGPKNFSAQDGVDLQGRRRNLAKINNTAGRDDSKNLLNGMNIAESSYLNIIKQSPFNVEQLANLIFYQSRMSTFSVTLDELKQVEQIRLENIKAQEQQLNKVTQRVLDDKVPEVENSNNTNSTNSTLQKPVNLIELKDVVIFNYQIITMEITGLFNVRCSPYKKYRDMCEFIFNLTIGGEERTSSYVKVQAPIWILGKTLNNFRGQYIKSIKNIMSTFNSKAQEIKTSVEKALNHFSDIFSQTKDGSYYSRLNTARSSMLNSLKGIFDEKRGQYEVQFKKLENIFKTPLLYLDEAVNSYIESRLQRIQKYSLLIRNYYKGVLDSYFNLPLMLQAGNKHFYQAIKKNYEYYEFLKFQQVTAYLSFLVKDFEQQVQPILEEIAQRIRSATQEFLWSMDDNTATKNSVPELNRFVNSMVLAQTAQVIMTKLNNFKIRLVEAQATYRQQVETDHSGVVSHFKKILDFYESLALTPQDYANMLEDVSYFSNPPFKSHLQMQTEEVSNLDEDFMDFLSEGVEKVRKQEFQTIINQVKSISQSFIDEYLDQLISQREDYRKVLFSLTAELTQFNEQYEKDTYSLIASYRNSMLDSQIQSLNLYDLGPGAYIPPDHLISEEEYAKLSEIEIYNWKNQYNIEKDVNDLKEQLQIFAESELQLIQNLRSMVSAYDFKTYQIFQVKSQNLIAGIVDEIPKHELVFDERSLVSFNHQDFHFLFKPERDITKVKLIEYYNSFIIDLDLQKVKFQSIQNKFYVQNYECYCDEDQPFWKSSFPGTQCSNCGSKDGKIRGFYHEFEILDSKLKQMILNILNIFGQDQTQFVAEQFPIDDTRIQQFTLPTPIGEPGTLMIETSPFNNRFISVKANPQLKVTLASSTGLSTLLTQSGGYAKGVLAEGDIYAEISSNIKEKLYGIAQIEIDLVPNSIIAGIYARYITMNPKFKCAQTQQKIIFAQIASNSTFDIKNSSQTEQKQKSESVSQENLALSMALDNIMKPIDVVKYLQLQITPGKVQNLKLGDKVCWSEEEISYTGYVDLIPPQQVDEAARKKVLLEVDL